jgi:16S rRNA (cytidine1402-2'-O)-methyltransferase
MVRTCRASAPRSRYLVPEPGTLFVCATPIGNLGDSSPRLLETLEAVDLIYAEDTRRTAKLLRHFGIATRTRSLFAGNEAARSEELADEVARGLDVALVSDAGMPGISDPGALAVRTVRSKGGSVTVVPGPSAVSMAVALAGFGGDRYVFEGFLPRKGQQRQAVVEAIALETRQVVIFASPHRVLVDLQDLRDSVGAERLIAINRELTKIHEESWVGTLGDAVELWSQREPKGEFTLVVAPGEAAAADLGSAIEQAKAMVTAGTSVSDASRLMASETGLSRREIYEKLLSDQALS